MKKVLKWGAIVFVILIVIGMLTGGKSETSSTGANEAKKEQPKEPMMATAQEIADDFDGNQVAAENKWNGKYVQFSSTVSNITDSGLSFTDIASKEFSMTQISCRVKNKEQVLSLKNGETVTVKGTIGKQAIGVIDMTDCEVLK